MSDSILIILITAYIYIVNYKFNINYSTNIF